MAVLGVPAVDLIFLSPHLLWEFPHAAQMQGGSALGCPTPLTFFSWKPACFSSTRLFLPNTLDWSLHGRMQPPPPPLLCAVPATASATAEVPVCVLLCPAVSTSKVVTLVL